MIALTINISKRISFATFCIKGTGQFVVGDEKTSATVVLNKNLWLEINKNTSSNERMSAVTDLWDGIGCAHYNSCLHSIPAIKILN